MPEKLLIINDSFKISTANHSTFINLAQQDYPAPSAEAIDNLRTEIKKLALKHNKEKEVCRTMVAGITADGTFCSYNVDSLIVKKTSWLPLIGQNFDYIKPDINYTSPQIIEEATKNTKRLQYIVSQLKLKFHTPTTAQSISNNFGQPQNPNFISKVEIHDHESLKSCRICRTSKNLYGRITANTLENISWECLARMLKESTHQYPIENFPKIKQSSKLHASQRKIEYRTISTQTELVSPKFYNEYKKQIKSTASNAFSDSDIAVPISITEGKDDHSLSPFPSSVNLKKHPTIPSVSLENEKSISRESQTYLPKVNQKVYTNKTDLFFTNYQHNADPILTTPPKAETLHPNYLTCDFKDINTTALGEKCIISLAYCLIPARSSIEKGIVVLTPDSNSPASKWSRTFIDLLTIAGYSVLLIERRNEGFSQKKLNTPYVSKHQNLNARHKKDPNLPKDTYGFSQTYTIPEIGHDYFELMKALGINNTNPAILVGYSQGALDSICGLAQHIEEQLRLPPVNSKGFAISHLVLLSISGVQKEVYTSFPNASADGYFNLTQPSVKKNSQNTFDANIPTYGIKRFWLPSPHRYAWLARDTLSMLTLASENTICRYLPMDKAYAFRQYCHPAIPNYNTGLNAMKSIEQTRIAEASIPAMSAILHYGYAPDRVNSIKIVKKFCDKYSILRSLVHGSEDICFAPDAFIDLEKAIGAKRHQIDYMGHMSIAGGTDSDLGCLELFMIIDNAQEAMKAEKVKTLSRLSYLQD